MDSLAFSPDSTMLAGIDAKSTYIWDVATGKLRAKLDGQPHASIYKNAISFDSSGKVLFTTFGRSRIKIWDVSRHRELASLFTFGPDDWVVVAPDGRFDTNLDLDNIEGLHWVVSDAPFTPKPLELFMRDYYEPALLGRLLRCTRDNSCKKDFKPLPLIADINRLQPKLSKPRVFPPPEK